MNERYELWIKTGASRTGILKLNINQGSVDVLVQAGDTPAEVAGKLLQGISMDQDFSNLWGAYNINVSDVNLIIFEATSPGDKDNLAITLD